MKEARSGEGFAPNKGGPGPLAKGDALPTRKTTFNQSIMPARLAERDEPLPIFVPQHQSHAPETLKQGQPADAVEVRMVAQHQRQSVKGDAAAQMMDVVNADISGEPAQRAR